MRRVDQRPVAHPALFVWGVVLAAFYALLWWWL